MQCMRKRFEKRDSWIEKNVAKHKHDFSIPCIYEKRQVNKPKTNTRYQIIYMSVFMCSKCHSFRYIKKPDSVFKIGFSLDKESVLSEEERKKPRIIGIEYSTYIDASSVDELYFPDNTTWKKEK